MTGKMGRNNCHGRHATTRPGEVMRPPGRTSWSRATASDLGERSASAASFINKDQRSTMRRFNRTVAADAVLPPTRSFSVHSFLAQDAAPWADRHQQAFQRERCSEHRWKTTASTPTSTRTSTPRWGSCHAPASRTTSTAPISSENPRPGGVIRVLEPMIDLRLHHRSEQPPDHAPDPPHGGDAVSEWHLPQRVHEPLVDAVWTNRSRFSAT